MPTSEWSLVLFTILVQISVGLLVVSEAARLAADGPAGRLLSWQTPAACALAAIGLMLSLTHLGTPTHSIFTILNVSNSWLSREILATGVFFLALLTLTVLRAKEPGKSNRSLALVATILGLTTVAVMSNVYFLSTVPAWNTIATALGFLGTALLSGAVAGGLLLAMQSRREKGFTNTPSLCGIFCVVAILGLGLQFLGIPLAIAAQGNAYNPTITGLFALSSKGLGLLSLRISLVFLGTVLFAWTMLRSRSLGDAPLPVRQHACALACVLAGEVLGRLLFYGSYLRVGL